MKKILIILFSSLIAFENAIAGKGTSCALEVDKGTRYDSYIKFDVYNPTDRAIIITGVKYYKGDTFWREYSDIYLTVGYKRNKQFTHSVNTSGQVSYVIQCYQKTASTSTYKPPKAKQKSGTQKFLDKILGN